MPSTALILLIGLTVFSLICGFIALAIAKSKGYGGGWFFLGFFFDIVGVIVTICIPDRSNREKIIERNNNAKTFWLCPKCGRTNNLNDKFCPGCGESYDETFKVDQNKWVCGHCGATNETTNKYCHSCGTERTAADAELEAKKETKEFIEENGIECEMCGRKALKLYNVKIEDDLGTRYRKVCEKCLSKHNCTIIEK